MSSTPWMSLLWFGLVLALIPGALWLLKRSGLAPAGLRGPGSGLRLTGSLAIGPQQRVITVEVGEGAERRWLVLGVTAQQISTLHTLAAPPVIAAAEGGCQPVAAATRPRKPRGFAQVLARALGQQKDLSRASPRSDVVARGPRTRPAGDGREA